MSLEPNAVTAGKIDTTSFSNSGLSIFGGTLTSNNYVKNQSGWRIEQNGNAQFAGLGIFGGALESNNYVNGSSGWRIGQNGYAEFDNIRIRRQIEVATGLIDHPVFTPLTASPAESGWASPGYTIYVESTPIDIAAWSGVHETYLAVAGHHSGGGVTAQGSPPDVYWGWAAEVLPLTRWNGNQSLRIKITFYSRRVSNVSAGTLRWKIYKVS